jgi:uncharacterized membrane protein YkvA (DUF1232 family)
MTTQTPRTWEMLPGILRDAHLAWRLWRDQRVPAWVKGIPLLSFIYILWPLDLLADPLFGLGQLDDLGVILLGLTLFIRLAPSELVAQYRGETAPEATPQAEAEDPWAARREQGAVRTTYRILESDEPPA